MGPIDHDGRRDRALGALFGLALGDALGMPTQELSRARAEELLGAGPVLLPGPPDNPISAGLPAGSITDDTEQALVLAQVLVDGGGTLDPVRFATALLEWQDRLAARGSLDLLGPTTRTALEAVRAGGDPRSTGRGGSTNGAAMRVAPIGVATPGRSPGGSRAGSPARIAAAVARAGRPTHDSPDGHAGAAAVAAVVSLGVDGAGFEESWPVALEAAALAADLASPGTGPGHDLPALISRAIRLARKARASAGIAAALDVIDQSVGTSLATHESVPAAFGVAALEPDDAWAAAWLGARLGGDADTIAAIAGAMVGACTGLAALPAEPLAVVRSMNSLDLSILVDQLLQLRLGHR